MEGGSLVTAAHLRSSSQDMIMRGTAYERRGINHQIGRQSKAGIGKDGGLSVAVPSATLQSRKAQKSHEENVRVLSLPGSGVNLSQCSCPIYSRKQDLSPPWRSVGKFSISLKKKRPGKQKQK